MSTPLLLPRRAGRARRNRRLDAMCSVDAVRRTQVLSRDRLMDEIEWLGWRAKVSGNHTVFMMLLFVRAAMERCQAHEMLNAMIDAEGRHG